MNLVVYYQGGPKEGQQIDTLAVKIAKEILDYGPNEDSPDKNYCFIGWNNFHESALEKLSDAVEDFRDLKKQDDFDKIRGNG